MTQTVYTPAGRSAIWIEADHGQGRRGAPRRIEWRRIELPEYIDMVDLVDLNEAQANKIKAEFSQFKRGFAWLVQDSDCESEIVATAAEARAWAYNRFC